MPDDRMEGYCGGSAGELLGLSLLSGALVGALVGAAVGAAIPTLRAAGTKIHDWERIDGEVAQLSLHVGTTTALEEGQGHRACRRA